MSDDARSTFAFTDAKLRCIIVLTTEKGTAMSSDVKKLMSRLGSFRPSDRSHLQAHLSDSRGVSVALDAIKEFVLVWERADWLEAYSIERIGKWVGKTQPSRIVDGLMAWAKQGESEARRALANGLKQGQRDSQPEFA